MAGKFQIYAEYNELIIVTKLIHDLYPTTPSDYENWLDINKFIRFVNNIGDMYDLNLTDKHWPIINIQDMHQNQVSLKTSFEGPVITCTKYLNGSLNTTTDIYGFLIDFTYSQENTDIINTNIEIFSEKLKIFNLNHYFVEITNIHNNHELQFITLKTLGPNYWRGVSNKLIKEKDMVDHLISSLEDIEANKKMTQDSKYYILKMYYRYRNINYPDTLF